MKPKFTFAILIASIQLSFSANAVCTNSPTLQSDYSFPTSVSGRLVYHSYINYNDGSSNLFLKDFRYNTLVQLNQSFWNITDPMNAHFSPNGRYLTFMGKQNSRCNIFIWKIDSSLAPQSLSHNSQITGNTSEDPKFSADGNYIVYKHNGDIVLGHLNYTNTNAPYIDISWNITTDNYAIEESMPYLSTDGKSVYYSQSARENSAIYQINYTLTNNQLFVNPPRAIANRQGIAEYYPVVKNNAVFFTGWKDTVGKRDQIYVLNSYGNNQAIELNLNDCNADDSDPMPIDAAHIVFSSTRGNSPFYNLYVGNISTGNVWSLNKFGVNQPQRQQLGVTYSSMR
jgi:Tol biopolymer transport system component